MLKQQSLSFKQLTKFEKGNKNEIGNACIQAFTFCEVVNTLNTKTRTQAKAKHNITRFF